MHIDLILGNAINSYITSAYWGRSE